MVNPDVTITLLTYNHKNYIRECLDGILKQNISFKLEVLVGDDCSTDGTQEILKEYDEKYPGKFTMILRGKNVGATKNLYDLLKRAKGKYIAGLEGDDYWFDKNKLQMQYDFLESNEKYIGCSHEVRVIDEYGRTWHFDGKYLKGCHWTFFKDVYTYDDYQKFIIPGQGSTYFYRNVFLKPKHDYSIIEKANPLIGDMTLMLILSSQGDWFFMKRRTMTCYRYINNGGGDSWASKTRNTNTTYSDYMYRCKLELYAQNVLHKKLDLSESKDEMIYGAYSRKMSSYDPVDEEIFNKIRKKSKHSFLYFLFMKIRYEREKKVMRTVVYAIKNDAIEKMMGKLKNNTWREFERASKGKTIVAFGAGAEFNEFLVKYGGKYSVPIVLDNNPKHDGGLFEACRDLWEAADGNYQFAEIMAPSCIDQWDKNRFIILITSTLYQNQIAEQLEGMGFTDYYSLGSMESKLNIYKKYYQN